MENSNTPKYVPDVIFKTRVPDDGGETVNVCEPGAFCWKDATSAEIFDNKKIVLFALPGAFTPTCSSTHLPEYDKRYYEFKDLGIDDVICLSVNDAFTMNSWAKELKVENVTMLPDGNSDFTKGMDMLVKKENLGFGDLSWRYSMFVDNGEIKKMFIEPGQSDNCPEDPFEVSDAETILEYLKSLE